MPTMEQAMDEGQVVDLATRVRDLRERLPKELRSRERTAHRGGLSTVTLYKIEQGQTVNPSLDTLTRVATALGITVSELLDGTEQEDHPR